MKKVFKILILLLLLFLTGCTKPFKYDLDTLEEEVISAEIVDIDVEESKVYELVNKVDDDRLKDLLKDLSMIQFEQDFGGPILPTGYALKLNYADGYELICNTWIERYDNNDELIEGEIIIVSLDKFNKLIDKYISYSMIN